MLDERQSTALLSREPSIDEVSWRVAALLGLPRARAVCPGPWAPMAPPVRGIESVLAADVLGLPPTFDEAIDLWRAPGSMHPTTCTAECLYRGPGAGLVLALLDALRVQCQAYADEAIVHDVYPMPQLMDPEDYYDALEAAEDAGDDIVHWVDHPVVPLWLTLRDGLHAEGGADACEVLSMPAGLRARVRIAWLQTNNSGDVLEGLVVVGADVSPPSLG